jgi:DNA-binding Xre family transcriptional regulator
MIKIHDDLKKVLREKINRRSTFHSTIYTIINGWKAGIVGTDLPQKKAWVCPYRSERAATPETTDKNAHAHGVSDLPHLSLFLEKVAVFQNEDQSKCALKYFIYANLYFHQDVLQLIRINFASNTLIYYQIYAFLLKCAYNPILFFQHTLTFKFTNRHTVAFELELEKLGKRIQQIRKHRKLRLLDLEILSGVNDSDLSRYERGKENIEFQTIFKIAVGLEVEVKELMDYGGPLPDNENFKGIGKTKTKKSKKRS